MTHLGSPQRSKSTEMSGLIESASAANIKPAPLVTSASSSSERMMEGSVPEEEFTSVPNSILTWVSPAP